MQLACYGEHLRALSAKSDLWQEMPLGHCTNNIAYLQLCVCDCMAGGSDDDRGDADR